MKIASIAMPLLFCSIVSRDCSLGQEPPAVNFLSRASPLPPAKRPKKVIDPRWMIRISARRHKVQAALVESIVKAESAFDANAVSPKGALGLMQLMPETARQYGADPFDPEQNIEAGTHYLSVLLNRYHRYRNCLPRVIAAYNAGPGIVDKYRGVPPYKETRGYVARVLTYLHEFRRQRG
jgi:soluble lytic murein transglycosylase-like protein